jgi:phosphoribosylamine--glycine ligase
MKKVLLVGNGAREHVVGETLRRSGAQLFCYGKARNPGLIELAEDYQTGSLEDFAKIREYALKIKPDFALIGPDDPIGAGLADALLEVGIHSVAPLKTVARLESSKGFTRELVRKYKIPGNPEFKVFLSEAGMAEFLKELGDNFVVKADGLMGGKGVKVSGDHLADHAEALAYARECLQAAGRVVIEEKLIGQEFSLMSFADGTHTAEMPIVQDHKRAFDGDRGSNTGGMGSYSDFNHLLPFLTPKDLDEARTITHLVAKALITETGAQFKGIMYGGFIATAGGVRLIEYNARFGDPESMNVLPLLKTNFVDVCEAVIHGKLDTLKVEFEKKATVCKYLVPEGYPDKPVKGKKIEIGKIPDGVKMYYSAVDQTEEGLMLSSSRAVAFVGIADSIVEAEKLAESACGCVKGPVFHRKDIGTAELISSRVAMMETLRPVGSGRS